MNQDHRDIDRLLKTNVEDQLAGLDWDRFARRAAGRLAAADLQSRSGRPVVRSLAVAAAVLLIVGGVAVVVSNLKAPGSGIKASLIDWAGIAHLGKGDELKIVCSGRNDYEWGRDLLRAGERFPAEVEVTFSPVQPDLVPRDLAEWILADGSNPGEIKNLRADLMESGLPVSVTGLPFNKLKYPGRY